MRLTLTTALAASLFGLLPTGAIQAATSPQSIAEVLASCPIEERVGQCGNAVIDFANGLPRNAERNDDLLALAGALAEEASGQDVSPFVCLELETSIRLAGQAAAGATTRDAILAIADDLCGEVDYTATGGTGGSGGNGYVPPESLIEQEDPDDLPPPPPPPPVDGDEDEDEYYT